jgi:hypothetical protein
MLSIMDPVDIDDLVAFRDDEDPSKFYLLPDEPVFSTRTDDGGKPVPDFYFIQFRSADGTHTEGGIVQFRTVLTVSPDRRAKVLAALKTLLTQEQAAGRKPFGLTIASTDPVLADPIWKSGTASIQTLQAGPNGLVTSAPDSALPCDLAGALGASGSLNLSPDGASIFWSAFTDYDVHKLPILITYQLVYRARVSASLTIDADASTIVQQIWQRAQPAPYLFNPTLARYDRLAFSGRFDLSGLQQLRITYPTAIAMVEPANVWTAVQSSVSDRTITVVIDTDESGGSGSGAGSSGDGTVQDALFKLATDLLVNDIVPAIFGTGPNGAPAQPLPTSNSANDPSATSKALPLPNQDVTAHFHIQMTSNSVIDRQVNPNGALQALISDPQVLKTCFKQLTLGDDFFSKKLVTICTAGVDFATDGITTIAVSGRYTQADEKSGQPPVGELNPDAVLKSASDTAHWGPFALSRDSAGTLKEGYEYATTVYYGDVKIATDWQPTTADALIIDPGAMGAVRVQLVLTAKREEISSVSVALSYRKPTGEVLSDVLILTPDEGRKTWVKSTGEVRPASPDAPAPTYTYQFTYVTVASGRISLPAQTANADTLEVPTPFPKTLTFNFAPQGSFENVSTIEGQLTYDDEAHDYKVVQSFSLASLTARSTVKVPVLDGGPEEASWTARIVYPDGSHTSLPSGHGGAGSYFVGLKEYPPFKVTVMPDLIDFDRDVHVAAVTLTYHDPVTGSDLTQPMKFSKANSTQQVWNIPQYAPSLPHQYDLDVRYLAFDPSKNAEFHLKGLTDPAPFLERTTGVSVSLPT